MPHLFFWEGTIQEACMNWWVQKSRTWCGVPMMSMNLPCCSPACHSDETQDAPSPCNPIRSMAGFTNGWMVLGNTSCKSTEIRAVGSDVSVHTYKTCMQQTTDNWQCMSLARWQKQSKSKFNMGRLSGFAESQAFLEKAHRATWLNFRGNKTEFCKRGRWNEVASVSPLMISGELSLSDSVLYLWFILKFAISFM